MYKSILWAVLWWTMASVCEAQTLVPKEDKHGRMGYVLEGQENFVIRPLWDEVRPFSKYGVAVVRNGKLYGLINRKGQYLYQKCSMIAPYDSTEYLLVAQDGRYERKERKIKNRRNIKVDFGGSTAYSIKNAKWGLMRIDGTFAISPEYQEIGRVIRKSIAYVQKNKKFGVVNMYGNVVLPARYSEISEVNNLGLVKYSNRDSMGVVTDRGKKLVEVATGKMSNFLLFEDNAEGSFDSKKIGEREFWGDSKYNYFCYIYSENGQPHIVIYDLEGNVILPSSAGLGTANVPSDDVVVGRKYKGGSKWDTSTECGLYDLKSKKWVPLADDKYTPFKQGCALAFGRGHYVVDKGGNIVSEQYDNSMITAEGYIVRKEDMSGLLNFKGKEVVRVKYDSVVYVEEHSLFYVKDFNGKFGYTNSSGMFVIPQEFDRKHSFVGDYISLGKSGREWGMVDVNNKQIVPFKYEDVVYNIGEKGELYIWVKINDRYYSYNVEAGKLTLSPYIWMRQCKEVLTARDVYGMYGMLKDDKEIVACNLESENEVWTLYDYMQKNGIKRMNAVEAKTWSVKMKTENERFDLIRTIREEYWDF